MKAKLFSISFIVVFFFSCDENSIKSHAKLPEVVTSQITCIADSTLQCGGIILDDGGADITDRGVCWSHYDIPTIRNQKTCDGCGTGRFSSKISGIDPATNYNVRAYAINDEGIGYGNVIHFNNEFNFNRNWTWEELTDFSNDEITRDRIRQLQSMLTIKQARFLLSAIDKFNKPEDIYHFTVMEKVQVEKGAGFHNIIPDHFQNKYIIPVPDGFNNKIKTSLYLTKVRTNNLRDLLLSNMNYHIGFIDEQMAPTKLTQSNIKLRLRTAGVEAVLALYRAPIITPNEAMSIANNEVYTKMLAIRRETGHIPGPYPNTEDLAYFIINSAKQSPLHKIWNWINPANNFGFSELYNNRLIYEKFLAYLKNNAEIFTNRIIAPLQNYLPASVSYSGEINLGVNFGVNIWTKNNSIGANLVQIKDDFYFYAIALRKALFKEIHKELIIKAPNINNQQDFVYADMGYWNFEAEKDRQFYSVLTLIYQKGISTFISGRPKGFDFIYQMKESVGILPQLYTFIYKKPDPIMVRQLIRFGSTKNGPFAGLGYLIARNIKTYLGKDEITRCIKNGPIYFFCKYCDIYCSKNNPSFKHFDAITIEKIKELYDKQKSYFVE